MRAFHTLPALAAAVAAVSGAVSGIAPTAVQAQGQYAAAAYVNGQAVTDYEVAQRQRFLTILRAPPEVINGALDALIDDRLREGAAKSMGVTVPEETVQAGMAEFAGRANLSVEQFQAAIGGAGIGPETFRDFVSAGVTWRQVVRARFRSQINVTDAEIDRAIDTKIDPSTMPDSPRLLLSEIIVQQKPEEDARAQLLIGRVAKLTRNEVDFASNARQYSTSASRDQGGKLDWLALSALPDQVRGQVGALKPGEMTAPIRIAPGTWSMFLLHERKAPPKALPNGVEALEYAQFYLPGKAANEGAEARKIQDRLDTCEDLYPEARGLPENQLVRRTVASNQVPADLAGALSRLDPGETTTLVSGDMLSIVMLCRRGQLLDTSTISRDAIKGQIENEKLVTMANAYMEQLRADAVIRKP